MPDLRNISCLDNVCFFRWLQKLYWNNDAFKSSTDFDHIKTHYYWSHPTVRTHLPLPSQLFHNVFIYPMFVQLIIVPDQPNQGRPCGTHSQHQAVMKEYEVRHVGFGRTPIIISKGYLCILFYQYDENYEKH